MCYRGGVGGWRACNPGPVPARAASFGPHPCVCAGVGGPRFLLRGREPCRPRPAPGEVRMGGPPPHPHHFLPGRGGGGAWGEGEEATGEGVRKNVLRFRGRVVLPPRPLSAGLALIHTPYVGPRPRSAPSLGPLPKRRGLRLLLPTLGAPAAPPCCFTPSFDLLPYRGQDPVELPTWCLPPRAPAAPGPASSPQDAQLPEPCLPVEIHLDSSLPPKSGPIAGLSPGSGQGQVYKQGQSRGSRGRGHL